MKIKLRTVALSSFTIAVIYLATESISIALAFGTLVAGITFIRPLNVWYPIGPISN